MLPHNSVMFTPPSRAFEPTFWETLYHKKLNVYRLDTAPVSVSAFSISGDERENGCMKFTGDSFVISTGKIPPGINGKLINLNKIEEFSAIDKKQLIIDEGHKILSQMAKGDAIRNPSLLNHFVLLTFADLKSYKFVFWFAQPTLSLKDGLQIKSPFSPVKNTFITVDDVTGEDSDLFLSTAYTYLVSRVAEGGDMPVIFAIRDMRPAKLSEFELSNQDASTRPIPELGFSEGDDNTTVVIDTPASTVTSPSDKASHYQALSLFDAWPYRYDSNNLHFVVLDQSHQHHTLGWTTRNFLSLLALYGSQDRSSYFLSSLFFSEYQQERAAPAAQATNDFKSVSIVALRNPLLRKLTSTTLSTASTIPQLVSQDLSISGVVQVPVLKLPDNFDALGRIDIPLLANTLFPNDSSTGMSIVGWEPNERGKAGPRVADLRASLDTHMLMTQAVDLNLRLMKWRQWPQLQVENLREQRCLLLGSGTLGCAVARALMGWGVRNVTFVDSGRVAFSNPVRQSLFTYDDAQQGKFKVHAAMEQILRIFPDMKVQAELLSIPMPGHPYTTSNGISGSTNGILLDENARERLDQLVQEHDIIFNLTDSREARWLPTVICQVYDKLCINAALGFDSYLVMHHGRRTKESSVASHGCYFCSDIVAAGNSQRDRTLDEQCTVTRPGLSFMAAALCAELMVALLHQPPTTATMSASSKDVDGDHEDDNGPDSTSVTPHQIRGDVLGFSQVCLQSPVFPCCTACSAPIVESYRTNPSKLVQDVATDPKYLETVSGIDALVRDVDINLCIDSDEEF